MDYATFTSDELEYIAENELIKVEPRFSAEQVNFLTGDFGPFSPGIPVFVPLWFAARLRQSGQCRIIPPKWLSVDELQRILADERALSASLTPLPFHYLEIATILLDCASEDIQHPDKVQELLDDVEKCRGNKLNSGLKLVLDAATREMVPHALQVDNISAMEVNMLRAGVFKALDHVVAMGDAQVTRDRRQEETALRGGGAGGRRARVRVQQQGSALRFAGAAGAASAPTSSPDSQSFDSGGNELAGPAASALAAADAVADEPEPEGASYAGAQDGTEPVDLS